jgi:hypothetical protein
MAIVNVVDFLPIQLPANQIGPIRIVQNRFAVVCRSW